MLSYLLNATEQKPWLAIFAMFLFMALFIASIIWTIRRDKEYIKKMSSLPIDANNHNGESNND
jgi:hypothetical protein